VRAIPGYLPAGIGSVAPTFLLDAPPVNPAVQEVCGYDARRVSTIRMVFLDIGGVLYDDRVYARAWRKALREAGAEFTDEEFDEEYAACRAAQDGSFRRKLADRFIGPEADVDELAKVAARYWDYPGTAVQPDVAPALERLRDDGYRLGLIANQPSDVRNALRRDGLGAYFDTWAISDDLGLHKPDPALFVEALRVADVQAGETAMVGDRLDYDIRPARAAGMRTVWLLRGEAPDEPTDEQLAEPDASIRDLADLPAALEALGART
jgi:HAD superfamily hydrolase (TIGR01549 family)